MSERSSTGQPLRYHTPEDVRAIPAEQWERWITAGAVPTERFLGEDTRKAAYHVMRATRRRMGR